MVLFVKIIAIHQAIGSSKETLDSFLKRENIPGIYDVDTRAIARKIRDNGVMKAVLANGDADVDALVNLLKSTPLDTNQVARVSTAKVFPIPNHGKKVVVVDFGARLSTLRDYQESWIRFNRRSI